MNSRKTKRRKFDLNSSSCSSSLPSPMYIFVFLVLLFAPPLDASVFTFPLFAPPPQSAPPPPFCRMQTERSHLKPATGAWKHTLAVSTLSAFPLRQPLTRKYFFQSNSFGFVPIWWLFRLLVTPPPHPPARQRHRWLGASDPGCGTPVTCWRQPDPCWTVPTWSDGRQGSCPHVNTLKFCLFTLEGRELVPHLRKYKQKLGVHDNV